MNVTQGDIQSIKANPGCDIAAFIIGINWVALSPEKLRPTKVAPNSSAKPHKSIA
ncbi:MAG: hypothetical protein R2795_03335 [Saprospiraceae bacterium]